MMIGIYYRETRCSDGKIPLSMETHCAMIGCLEDDEFGG
jgi:hypothetical protein